MTSSLLETLSLSRMPKARHPKPRKIPHTNPKKLRQTKTIPNQLKHGEAPRGERENRIGKGGLGEIVGGASWLSSFSSIPDKPH